MNKTLCLLALFCALPTAYAHADIVASGEDFEAPTAQQQQVVREEQQQLNVRFDFADMVDTGTNISQAAIAPTQVASVTGEAPAANCRLYQTRASFYSSGKRVAYHSQRFNPNGNSMATLNLRLGQTVFVKMPGSSNWVKGVANDRGPYVGGRGADLSIGYARSVGFPLGRGVAKIDIAACGGGDEPTYASRHKRRKG